MPAIPSNSTPPPTKSGTAFLLINDGSGSGIGSIASKIAVSSSGEMVGAKSSGGGGGGVGGGIAKDFLLFPPLNKPLNPNFDICTI